MRFRRRHSFPFSVWMTSRNMLYSQSYLSPVGNLNLYASSNSLKKIEFSSATVEDKSNAVLEKAVQQLDEYFSGQRTQFDLELDPEGTAFQKSVWTNLISIPYGSTCSYQDLANAIENPKASRAVGNANNRNPLPIVIPCHRVIGKDKSLVGYAGGLPLKQWLLDHERQ
uniref:Methylated-DNA--protein-cysteine methyltransferase n=1 Tax=uncultured bacterium Ak20-3 TaxID=798570 RepID=D9MX72_9BACT|nr:hypothetical protein AKSOIL_0341 [uncultured bacterium Ak20-3]